MNESEPERPAQPGAADEEDFVPTPFDGPYFLPVVLLGLAIWFGYDGWITDDASMAEWWWFNQGGAVLFAVWGAWSLRRAIREGRDGADA